MLSRTATAAQLLIGLVFLLLVLLIQFSRDALSRSSAIAIETREPEAEKVGPLPKCIPGASGKCFSFVFAPTNTATSALAAEIQRASAAAGTGVAGLDEEAFGYRGFGTAAALDLWLSSNPNRTKIALVFTDVSGPPTFSYDLQINTTRDCEELGFFGCSKPHLELTAPAQLAVDQALLRLHAVDATGAPDAAARATASIAVEYSNFPHPDLPVLFFAFERYGNTFLYIALIFNFVIQGCQVVREKEKHLRLALKQIGMLESAYWASWLAINVAVNTAMVFLLIVVGHILGFDFFTENAFGLYFFTFWLTTLSFTGLAYMFSALTHSTSTMRAFGIIFYILTFITAPLLSGFVMNDTEASYDVYRRVLSLFVPLAFWNTAQHVIEASAGVTALGMDWADRGTNLIGNTDDGSERGFWAIESGLSYLLLSFFVYVFFAYYFDNVKADSYGNKKKPWFLCMADYWRTDKRKRELRRERERQQAAGGADDRCIIHV